MVQQYDRVLKDAPGGSFLANEFDLDKYVVGKTLDGLFYTLGERGEEDMQESRRADYGSA